MTTDLEYRFEVRPLSDYEGGGWLVSFPELPGCMSDGETPEEAIENAKDALTVWLKAQREAGREPPEPGEAYSGRFVARVPRSLHARLAARASQEGVSMNALVTSYIAEGLGRLDPMSSDKEVSS
jgi:antitoxin HicB